MASCELEFRGIPLDHLRMYLKELGANEMTNQLPYLFEGDHWTAEIKSHGELTFTSVFKVNSVIIHFTAENDAKLSELIRKYRFKTTRIGG